MRKALCAVLVLGLTPPVLSVDLVARSWPMDSRTYDRVDLHEVRFDGLRSFPEWLALTGDQNPSLSQDLSAQPVMAFDIRIEEDEDGQPTLEAFVDEARRRAARIGANLIFADDTVQEPGGDHGYVAAHFTAYRVTYKAWLVPPLYLAAMTGTSVAPSLLSEELAKSERARVGRNQTTFAGLWDFDRRLKVLDYMRRLRPGDKVRIVLRDGTEVRGSYAGIDEDDSIWIDRIGLARFISQRSVTPTDVQSLSILD